MSRRPNPVEISFLMIWHGVLSGGMLVAYLTAEASGAMHLFSGAVVLLAIVVRVAVGIIVLPGTPLALGISLGAPLAKASPATNKEAAFLGQSKKLIKEAMALVMLLAIGAAALSGWLIFDAGFDDDFHEGTAVLAGFAVLAHLGLVVLFHSLKGLSKAPAKRA